MSYPDPETLKKNRRKAIQYGVINITVLIVITYICVRFFPGITVWQYYLVLGSYVVVSGVTMWLRRKRSR